MTVEEQDACYLLWRVVRYTQFLFHKPFVDKWQSLRCSEEVAV